MVRVRVRILELRAKWPKLVVFGFWTGDLSIFLFLLGFFGWGFRIDFDGFGEEVEFWLDLGLGVVEMQNLTHFGLVAMEFCWGRF